MARPHRPAIEPERLTADECDTRALKALEDAGHRGLTASDVGFKIWKDRKFDRRGAGFAAIRVLRRLEDAGKVNQTWGTYNATWSFVPARGTTAPATPRAPTKPTNKTADDDPFH